MSRVLGYRASLEWIINNDDTEFLEDDPEDIIPSITASFLADQFDKEPAQVVNDLLKMKQKVENQ